MKNILVPSDFSELSNMALITAKKIAKGTSGKIENIHIV